MNERKALFICPMCSKEFSRKVDILEHWDVELASTIEEIERRWRKEFWAKKKREAEGHLTDE